MQMRWLSQGDPIKLQAFEQMAMLEYLLLLNEHIGEVLKQNGAKKATR